MSGSRAAFASRVTPAIDHSGLPGDPRVGRPVLAVALEGPEQGRLLLCLLRPANEQHPLGPASGLERSQVLAGDVVLALPLGESTHGIR